MSTTARPKTHRKRAIDRPFDPQVLGRARKIAASYQVVIRFDEDSREYYGRGVELPMTMDDGKTLAECVRNTMEAFVATVAYMLERGETPPPPATEEIRTEQVNIRLTAIEKLMLEAMAGQRGYRSLSDYMRAASMSGPATTVTQIAKAKPVPARGKRGINV
jgi:predicted RNase H-like HicB family nuclease